MSCFSALADANKKGAKEQNENEINEYKTLTKGNLSYYYYLDLPSKIYSRK